MLQKTRPLHKAAMCGKTAINASDIPICDGGGTKIRMGFLKFSSQEKIC